MNWKLLPLLLAAIAFPFTALSAEISDPVGAFRLRLRGNSDTIVSLPLQRPALIEATVASRSANAITLSADLPTLPASGAFALVMSGSLEGAVLPISVASGRTATVGVTGFDLSSLKTAASHSAALADLVAIVPYWTLDTLFPAGQGVHASTSPSVRSTEVLLFDPTRAGINLSATSTFFYFAGNPSKPAGWYKVGDTASALGTQRLDPHAWFILRHNVPSETSLVIFGGVQMAGFRLPLALLAANTAQDNFVALPIATPITLGNSRLVASGAFIASTSPAARADELLVYDNSIVGHNKSAAATFFYFAGNPSKAAGWYRVGDTAQTADSFQLKPGEGYVIRKQSGATPRVDQWNGFPTYLQ